LPDAIRVLGNGLNFATGGDNFETGNFDWNTAHKFFSLLNSVLAIYHDFGVWFFVLPLAHIRQQKATKENSPEKMKISQDYSVGGIGEGFS
jgi:uncharacterized protein YutD